MSEIMNVGDIIAAASTSSLVATAKEIGTNNKYLSKALRVLNYQFVQGKGWQYTGEGVAPDDMPLKEFLKLCKKHITKVTPSNTPVTQITEGNTPVTQVTEVTEIQEMTNPFTQNDVTDLLAMLAEWRTKKSNTNVIEITETIFERLQLLPKNPSTRKTYVIDEEVAAAFDAYCTKKNINKSHAITVALQDFLNKY